MHSWRSIGAQRGSVAWSEGRWSGSSIRTARVSASRVADLFKSIRVSPVAHAESGIARGSAQGMPAKRKMVNIGTHSGSFHCDEALGCYMLKQTKEFGEGEVTRR